jgi:hypothetical protein
MQKRFYLLAMLFFSCTVSLMGQTIKGKVVSTEDKQGIPGVNIIIKGSSTGTTTDIDGLFSLPAKKGEVLLVSFVGMYSREITITENNFYNIELQPQTEELSDVVVTALGLSATKRHWGMRFKKLVAMK